MLIEIKPKFQLTNEIVLLKKEAAEKYVSNKGWKYNFWDEEYIKNYEIKLDIKAVLKDDYCKK